MTSLGLRKRLLTGSAGDINHLIHAQRF